MKAARKRKDYIWRGTNIRIVPNFLSQTMQARRQSSDIFKVLKENHWAKTVLGGKLRSSKGPTSNLAAVPLRSYFS